MAGVQTLVTQAVEAEPLGGSSVPWAESLKSLGVAPMPGPQRLPSCQARGQKRGAPVEEVNAALEAMVSSRRALVLQTLTVEQQQVASEGLRTLLTHAKEHFAKKSTEVVKRGLFAHAKVDASKHKYGTSSKPEVYVMECPTCRGPRQTEALSCVFCGGEL